MNPSVRHARRHRTKVARPVPADPHPRSSKPPEPATLPLDWSCYATAAVLSIVFVWAHWSTLAELVHIWSTQPDYSHGFLVIPVAAYLLWSRREQFPGLLQQPGWWGLGLIVASIAGRGIGRLYFIEALDSWSIMLWCAGVAALLGGWPVLRWSWPAILFLFFMVPLPFRLEQAVTLPLQRFATEATCFILQTIGQPALAEGNTIWLGDHHLEVEQACAGLRIFMGIIALAFAYTIVTSRGRLERVALLAASIPVALLANVLRIVATGLLYQMGWNEAARKLTHDLAGWVMIPLAMLLFAILLWYGRKLLPVLPVADVRQLVHRGRSTAVLRGQPLRGFTNEADAN